MSWRQIKIEERFGFQYGSDIVNFLKVTIMASTLEKLLALDIRDYVNHLSSQDPSFIKKRVLIKYEYKDNLKKAT